MRVALVTVGDELLAGDTVNTNAAWLGEQLTARGATVERVVVVPDRIADIARVINEHYAEYDAVVVTGGLGPTHDDVTMEGVAAAFGRPVEENAAAIEWLTERGGYERNDLAGGTADLPAGAVPLHNEVGVAPGCIVESDDSWSAAESDGSGDTDGEPDERSAGTVYVLPGVPTEMKAMFEAIADRFSGTKRSVEVVTVDEPESALLDRFAELQEQFGVKVGSYPGEHVRVKLEDEDEATVVAAAAWLRENSNAV